MLRLKAGRARLRGEFSPSGASYVHRLHGFTVRGKRYLAVARSGGLVQLYERSGGAHRLVREWKNSTASAADLVVAVGCLRNQYMYTCLGDGQLVVRDLVNDDASDSVRTYYVTGPVLCVLVLEAGAQRVLVAAGGKDNDTKVYVLELDAAPVLVLPRLDEPLLVRLRSHAFPLHGAFCDRRRLFPAAVAGALEADAHHCLNSWLLSACFAGHPRRLFVGSQFGELAVYDVDEPFGASLAPVHTARLLRFPISTLCAFGRYVLYTDTMSKAGVIDSASMRIVNYYPDLQMGPAMCCRVYCRTPLPKVSPRLRLSRFEPVYLVAASIDGTLVVYRLSDDNGAELKLKLRGVGTIPLIDALDLDPYAALEHLYGAPQPAAKRQRRESRILPVLALVEPRRDKDGLAHDIKTMKIANND